MAGTRDGHAGHHAPQRKGQSLQGSCGAPVRDGLCPDIPAAAAIPRTARPGGGGVRRRLGGRPVCGSSACRAGLWPRLRPRERRRFAPCAPEQAGGNGRACQPQKGQRRRNRHEAGQKGVQRRQQKRESGGAEEQPQREGDRPPHGTEDALLQEPPLGFAKVAQTDDKFSQTFHSSGYLRCLKRLERTQPAPNAMSRLARGLRRTCSLTSSTPAAPAS